MLDINFNFWARIDCWRLNVHQFPLSTKSLGDANAEFGKREDTATPFNRGRLHDPIPTCWLHTWLTAIWYKVDVYLAKIPQKVFDLNQQIHLLQTKTPSSACSTSAQEMFSPPRMIMSLALSRMYTKLCSSIAPMSPERNHKSPWSSIWKTSAVLSGFLQYL